MGKSLAVKYRPGTFDDVLGQSIAKEVLQGQLRDNNIKQGYLFVGSSGVGKTTIARTFANQVDGNNIIEVDGASNSGVDNIRKIIDASQSKPMVGTHKIFIIDECHMLSISAWNALLKTLEEPPKHILFILCTTESHKVPDTILSRVQRFDLTPVRATHIYGRLKKICEQENINIEENALKLLAKMSNGGVRKAISYLDVLQQYEDINIHTIISVFGAGNYYSFIRLTMDVLKDRMDRERNKEQRGKIIEFLTSMYYEGVNLKQFYKQYTLFLNEVLIYSVMDSFDHISIPKSYKKQLDIMVASQKDMEILFKFIMEQQNYINNSEDLLLDLITVMVHLNPIIQK